MKTVKRISGFVLGFLIAVGFSGCAASMDGTEDLAEVMPEEDVQESEVWEEQVVMYSIKITADETVLYGVLYDNPTARGFAEMLPLTVNLWHPAPDFARAFDLPEQIAEKGTPGREYELGSLAYWDAGPSIALIYKASRTQTVVPVVPIGKISSDVSLFEEYGGSITIEIDNDTEPAENSGGSAEQDNNL